MKEIEIIRVTLTKDSIESSMFHDKEVVMEVLANMAMMAYGEEHDTEILSLWVGVVMRALACDMTGKLQKRTLKMMDQQIPILRASLQLQHERMEQEEDEEED